MPRLIKNIESKVIDNFVGDLNFGRTLSSSVQFEDYINLNDFIAYLQNFSKVVGVENLSKPLKFGLKNQYNQPTITLEISY